MPSRFNSKSKENHGVLPLPTGYPNSDEISNYVIPPVGIEDVDVGIFNLFDKEIPFVVGGSEGQESKKVPVVFAGGEKWALIKKNKPLRDKIGSLILPLITIVRPNITQNSAEDLAGRGINQKTGEITITRKLDKSDRSYQNLINRFFINGQESLAVNEPVSEDGQLYTSNRIGDLRNDDFTMGSSYLTPNRLNNVYETIVIPSPQFYTANYEITIWTQYTHHMNQILETMISSYLPQTQGWRIDTPKGYWFVAIASDETYTAETNFDEMSQDERTIKYKFNVKVPAYILAASAPGIPIPVKRYVSCPNIVFSTVASSEPTGHVDSVNGIVEDPFIGADDPTLPIDDRQSPREDQRRTNGNYLFSGASIDPNDPALTSRGRGQRGPLYKKISYKDSSGKLVTQMTRVANSSFGETVFIPNSDFGQYGLGGIETTIIDD